jgi:hypothetical protein
MLKNYIESLKGNFDFMGDKSADISIFATRNPSIFMVDQIK